MTGQEVVT